MKLEDGCVRSKYFKVKVSLLRQLTNESVSAEMTVLNKLVLLFDLEISDPLMTDGRTCSRKQ